MKTKQEKEQVKVMSGEKDWYKQAGRYPLAEPGFTPQLMARIEEATAEGSSGKSGLRRPFGRVAALGGLAAILLLVTLIWPFGPGAGLDPAGRLAAVFKPGSGAAVVQPSASPNAASSASPQSYSPPVGSAEFELGGMKYYMPLPMNRDKSRARAVETNAGIVWSPPPPMVNYSKPKYTHPTEPYTLYLSPIGQSELSEATAKRIYTLPLYAGGSQRYYELTGICDGGDYVVLGIGTITLGKGIGMTPEKLSVLNLKSAAAGETVTPQELLDLSSLDDKYTVYRSFIAFDKFNSEMLLVYYTKNGNNGYDMHGALYDLATGAVQNISSKIGINVQGQQQTAIYEVNGKKRKADIVLLLGQQWYYEWFYQEHGQQIDPAKTGK
ncbi:hypothetical protein [Paenibacillus silagei]|uniref:DUF4367 domain-containing protein n=1 Tax=Paenibacillus silagei TaxID=1670801 RepID=A0ABS4NP79_9BACL|nr:hypothetical protein [Paenibacillus silagei]MBP2111878.1 hypothetical protein [Paenibacillus silagei]